MINMGEIFAFDRLGDLNYELVPLTTREQVNGLVEEGDLLFARQSLTYEGAGKCSLVVAGGMRTWESHLIRVRLNKAQAVPAYYFNYFRSSAGRQSIESIVQQVAAAGIRGSDLAALIVPVPPLATQRAVAALLGALDDKIEGNIALARTAELLARSHFAALASAAQLESLALISPPILGGTPDRANPVFWGSGSPWASARDVAAAPSGVLIDTAEQITAAACISATRLAPHPVGTVFLTARGTVGAIARAAVPSSINQSCYAFRAPTHRSALLYLTVAYGIERMRAMAHGSVFSTITMPTIAAIRVPDFRTFSDEAAELVESLLDVAAQSIRENLVLVELRNALLPALMSGRLRVKDAERQVEDAV